MLAELEELDESRAWPRLFQKLNWEANQRAGALTVARLPQNRQLNRYRDVLPYDHSRITLKEGSPDYINANLVEVSRLNKKYILTQGPLPHTAKHFWQMIWEQNTAAVIMLNKVIEKNQIKCYQYWPSGEAHDHVNQVEFGNFKIYYLQELRNEYFTIRSLELENTLTGEIRPIQHFHYLTWPDFGVPTSPATFLAFLFEVRRAGAMSDDVGPCVIHCSAGIGRSGTFVMVDSALTEIEREEDMNQIDIQAMLLEIRKYRVGLIQTPDQLRFTYLAILEGVRVLMPDIYRRAVSQQLQSNAETGDQDGEGPAVKKDDESQETPPPLPPRRRHAETADEPETKKSRIGELEPEEEEVFSDSASDGSDEIINLSSLSESEPDDETEQIKISLDESRDDAKNSLEKETLENDNSKKQNEQFLINNDEGSQQTKKVLPLTEEGPQCKHHQPTGEGPDQTNEGDHQPTGEGCQATEGGHHPSDDGSQHAKEGCQHAGEHLPPLSERCQDATGGVKTTDEGLQSASPKENESAMQVRKRREERKQKISNLVDTIKKNVRQNEDTRMWKSRVKNSLIVLAVCSVAYITYRYFTSG